MNLLIKLAFRNILRQKRRTILTVLAITIGFIVTSLVMSLMEGIYSDVINKFTRNQTGHVQIHFKDYADNPTLYKSLKKGGEIEKIIINDKDVIAYAPRIYSGALAYFNNKTIGVSLIGVDAKLENQLTYLKNKIAQGSYFNKEKNNQVLITNDLAEVLNINIGDDLILISQGADGSIANDIFKVQAILKSDQQGQMLYTSLETIEEFLSLYGQIHEYSLITDSYKNAQKLAQKLTIKIDNKDISVLPWQDIEKVFYRAMTIDKNNAKVTVSIIIFVVALAILNTILMSVLERTYEFGIIRSLGTKSSQIFLLIILEMMFIVFFALIVGIILSSLMNGYFAFKGIIFATPIDFGGMKIEGIKGSMDLIRTVLIPAVIIIFTCFLTAIIPAFRAAKIIPIKTIKSI